jgi:phosphatidylglycerophosphatase A
MVNPEAKSPLGNPRRRWEDNIKIDLREVGSGDMGWIGLDEVWGYWSALVNVVMSLLFP